jgi:hypothetical protein
MTLTEYKIVNKEFVMAEEKKTAIPILINWKTDHGPVL